MIKENVVAFRVSLYDIENPQRFYKDVYPENCIRKQWISQTLGEQIWMWFEFLNIEDKNDFIDKINMCDIKYEQPWKGNGKYCYPKDMFMHDSEMFTQDLIDNYTK